VDEQKNRVLLFTYTSIFLSSLSFGTGIVLLPVFIQGLGGSYVDMGLVGAVRGIPMVFLVLFIGYLADRVNRSTLFIVSLLLNAPPFIALIFATEIYQIIIIQIFQGIANAILFPASDILIADLAPKKERIKVMGRYEGSIISGFLVGPILGGIIVDFFSFEALFLTSGIITLVGGILAWGTIGRSYIPPIRKEDLIVKFSKLNIIRILPVILVMLPYGVVIAVLISIFPGYVSNLGFVPMQVGFILATLSFSRIIICFNIEKVMKIGVRRVIAMAGSGLTISLIFLSFQQGIIGLSIAVFIVGIFSGILFPVVLAFIPQRVPRKNIGTAMGLLSASHGLGSLIGPIGGGIIAVLWAPNVVYIALGLLTIIIIPLSLTWGKQEK
tara:strand:+ start:101 stop:1252 length:1152 start_codon:yes stop_codon:yes gene_type:complete